MIEEAGRYFGALLVSGSSCSRAPKLWVKPFNFEANVIHNVALSHNESRLSSLEG